MRCGCQARSRRGGSLAEEACTFWVRNMACTMLVRKVHVCMHARLVPATDDAALGPI